MEKWVNILFVFLILIFILLLFFIPKSSSSKFTFTETSGVVKDENGLPLEGANVRIVYFCDDFVTDKSDYTTMKSFINKFSALKNGFIYGYRDNITDSYGKFHFNPLVVDHLSVPFKNKCKKTILVEKYGYECKEPYNKSMGCDFELPENTHKTISSQEKNIELKIYKISNFNLSEPECKIFIQDCLGSKNLRNSIISRNFSKCYETCYYKNEEGKFVLNEPCGHLQKNLGSRYFEECVIEIILSQKDPSICNIPIYLEDTSYDKSDYDFRFVVGADEDNEKFKGYCFIQLAKELKDLNICNNFVIGERRNNCIKIVQSNPKDIKNCDLLDDTITEYDTISDREECRIYFS